MQRKGLVLVSLIGLVLLLLMSGCTTTEQPVQSSEITASPHEEVPQAQGTAALYRVGIDAA